VIVFRRASEHHRMRLFDPVSLSTKYRSEYDCESGVRPFDEVMNRVSTKASYVVGEHSVFLLFCNAFENIYTEM